MRCMLCLERHANEASARAKSEDLQRAEQSNARPAGKGEAFYLRKYGRGDGMRHGLLVYGLVGDEGFLRLLCVGEGCLSVD